MQFKIPGQPPPNPLELLEPCVSPKIKSKIEISGLAPTGSEIARVPFQKRMKKKLKNLNKADVGPLHSDAESLDSSFSGSSNWSTVPKLLAERNINDNNQRRGSSEKRRRGKKVSFTDMFPESEEPEGQKYCFLENNFGSDGQKKKKNSTGVGGDCFENLESGRKTAKAFRTITKCISSVLGKDECMDNLEITPVDLNFQNIHEENKKPLITSCSLDSVPSRSENDDGVNSTAVLMGEIDLHLELQNYLKAFNSCSGSKTRTKNTLHSNNPITKLEEKELRAEELSEGIDKPKILQSVHDDGNHNFYDELEEERIESRLVRSQTKLPNVLKQMQKIKLIEKGLKGTFLTGKSVGDSYEKIIPLKSTPSGGLNNGFYAPGESVPSNDLVRESSMKFEKKQPPSVSLELQDMIEVYKNVLNEYDRLRRRGWKSVYSSLSCYLVTLLNEKLIQKRSKANLLNISKEMSDRQGLKRLSRRMESHIVKEYVAMFQKLLKSSMTITQITRLNGVISSWASSSEEYIKYLMSSLEKSKAAQNKTKKTQEEEPKPKSPERCLSFETFSTTSLLKGTEGKKKEKAPTSPSPSPPPHSQHLQNVLESFFNSSGKDLSGLSKLKGKMLVDVKLAGSLIHVNELSFLKNKVPPRKPEEDEGTSELIIETVGKLDPNNFLNDKTKISGTKQVRKLTKPKKRKKKKEKPAEVLQETVKGFEYDGMQLRTQHPIDPISESSELKMAEEKEVDDKKPEVDDDLLKKTLENQKFLKEIIDTLKSNEEMGEVLGSKTPISELTKEQQLPLVLDTKPLKTVRSLVDLSTSSAIWKNVHKTPSEWSRRFFCYSSLQSTKDCLFKENKNEKKIGNLGKIKRKMHDFAIQKSGAAVSDEPTPRPGDSCPLELSKCSKKESLLTGCALSVRHKQNPTCSLRDMIQEEEPGMSIGSAKSSIVFHSFNNSTSDDNSFSLDLIHSDSFLKKFSDSSILERDTTMLFKNNSDIKFSPVKVRESRSKAEPFITFVLSPEQCEKVDFAADGVAIVKKKKHPPGSNTEEPTKVEETNLEVQKDLQSIEKFMDVIASTSAKARKKKRKNKSVERKFYPPSFSERKSKTRCQTCQLLSMQEKQKKETKKVNADSKSNVKACKNTKPLPQKETKNLRKQWEREMSDEVSYEIQNEKTVAENEKKENPTTPEEVENMSKMSVKLDDVPVELLEALKNAFSQTDDSKKNKIATAIEKNIEKRQEKGDKTGDGKNPVGFVLKLNPEKREDEKNDEDTKKEEIKEMKEEEEKEEDMIVTNKETSDEDEDSTFFDALEKNLKDDFGGAGEEIKTHSRQGMKETSVPKPHPMPPNTNSQPSGKPEDHIMSQISNSLIEGQISYSLLMLNSFLKKKEKFFSKKEKSANLLKLIQHVEEGTENLMSNLERNAWEKVVLFLEALSQLIDESGGENLKSHLESTKAVVNEFLELNVSRLDDLHKFNASISQQSDNGKEKDGGTFEVVKQCLKHFRKRFRSEGNSSQTPEINGEEIQKELNKSSSKESVLSEIRDMKNKLVEDLRSLEKMFSGSEVTRSSSSFEETSAVSGSDRGGGSPTEDWLNRTYGCMHLMQCLMKVWDTRMSLNMYPSDCFQ